MPSKGFNSLTLSECEMGCRYEAMRQQWFEQRGDRQRALQAYRKRSGPCCATSNSALKCGSVTAEVFDCKANLPPD